MLTSRKRSDNRVSGSLSSSHLQYKPETDIDVYFIIYILEKRDDCETNEQYSNTGIFHNCFDIVIKNRKCLCINNITNILAVYGSQLMT